MKSHPVPGSFPREGTPIPLAIACLCMLLIGVGAAAVFLGILAPFFGDEKVRIVFDHSQDLNELLRRLDPQKNGHTAQEPVCGNRVCETGESKATCLQDCFVCNANGQCETGLGENRETCPEECPPST